MSQVRIFKFNKHGESADAFECRVNHWLDKQGDYKLLSVQESVHNSDIIFVFQAFGEKKSIAQELCVIAWSDLDTLEGQVNAALSGLEETRRRATSIHFVTTAKGPRSLAAFVVEGNRFDPPSSEPEQTRELTPENPKEAKQDAPVDVKPKRSRKPKGVVGH